MTRNMALNDANVGDVGIKDQSIAAMRGGASTLEPTQEEGFQVGIISLQLKYTIHF
jgi:hypothetical protein